MSRLRSIMPPVTTTDQVIRYSIGERQRLRGDRDILRHEPELQRRMAEPGRRRHHFFRRDSPRPFQRMREIGELRNDGDDELAGGRHIGAEDAERRGRRRGGGGDIGRGRGDELGGRVRGRGLPDADAEQRRGDGQGLRAREGAADRFVSIFSLSCLPLVGAALRRGGATDKKSRRPRGRAFMRDSIGTAALLILAPLWAAPRARVSAQHIDAIRAPA